MGLCLLGFLIFLETPMMMTPSLAWTTPLPTLRTTQLLPSQLFLMTSPLFLALSDGALASM
jgi:hypothetical protein